MRPGGDAPIQLLAERSDGWQQFRESVEALCRRVPRPSSSLAEQAFRGAHLQFSRPLWALLLSSGLHIAVVLSPLPGFLTYIPKADIQFVRIEYDLNWATEPLYLPPVHPAPREKAELPTPEATEEKLVKLPELPDRNPEAPQMIVSSPMRPNHPTQTLLTRFPEPRAPVDSLEVSLPNLVLPSSPQAAPEIAVAPTWVEAPTETQPVERTPLPPRPPTAAEKALVETRLEKVVPRVRVPGEEESPDAPAVSRPPVPKVENAAASAPIISLSARPALPTGALELPQTRLRARFATGTQPDAEGEIEAPSMNLAGVANPAGIEAPDLFVAGNDAVPPAPVASPAKEAAPDREALSDAMAALRARADANRTGSTSDAEARRRAQRLLGGVSPGSLQQPRGFRRVYTVYVNMPNLSSATGSWVLRFAELGEASRTAAGGAADGLPVQAPVPVKKVDPRYPAEAQRARLEGVVRLYGIVNTDGRVESITVVQSVHEILDRSAAEALQRWEFRPGYKNGVPVRLEVVVEVPFRSTPPS